MNTEYILQQIRPYVVESQMTYADFERAFAFLERRERDAVRNIIRNVLKIFLVDELVTDIEPADETSVDEADATILKQKSEIRASNRILIELVQRGDEQAKQDLFVKNSGLVCKFAQRYLNRFPCKLALEDLVQEGQARCLRQFPQRQKSRHACDEGFRHGRRHPRHQKRVALRGTRQRLRLRAGDRACVPARCMPKVSSSSARRRRNFLRVTATASRRQVQRTFFPST